MRAWHVQLMLAALCLAGCAAPTPAAVSRPARVFEARTPMGTYMAVTVYASDEAAGRAAIAAAFERVEDIEAAASTYRRNSEVEKLRHAAGGPPMAVGPDLWRVLERAAEVSAETGGAFDVTVGPLVALWKKTWRRGKAPKADDLAAARALVGMSNVRLVREGRRVQLLKPGMRLVPGGIAKGYAVDQAVAVLRERGIQAALVDAGGDIFALGAPPERQAWLIGVRDPVHPGKILPKPLAVRDRAVATSGDYEQFGIVGGRRVSHILDPRTGQPVQGVTSVTVVAPDTMTADAYATAASVLGPAAAVAFADARPAIEMMIISRQDDTVTETRSRGFADIEVARTAKP